jgi:hypothetical protein
MVVTAEESCRTSRQRGRDAENAKVRRYTKTLMNSAQSRIIVILNPKPCQVKDFS